MFSTVLYALIFVVALCVAIFLAATRRKPKRLRAANGPEGTHETGIISKRVSAALATRWLLGKVGTDSSHVAPTSAASDFPQCIIGDEAEFAEDPVRCLMLGATRGTAKMVAAGVIAYDAEVYTAASGQVQALPVASGTYWKVGRSMQLQSTATGDAFEVVPIYPVKLVIP